jgi:hypothetical protein
MADGAARVRRRPLYARLLRLHRLRPGPVLCFIFLEGAIALGVLLALANLASWWTVLALPAAVALMVKLNDVVAAATSRPPKKPGPPAVKPVVERELPEPEKPEWPMPGNPSKPLIEDEEDEEAQEDDEDEEEDTEKTEPPEATRSESDESVTR